MITFSPFGCFLCSDDAHRAENCWTRTPPTSRDHHDARIATYKLWFTDQARVTPQQKRKLIEHENAMESERRKAAEERKSA